MISTRSKTISAALATLAVAGFAHAVEYPNKPIRFISPYAPGGSVEAVARQVTTRVGKSLGQSIIIEARPGAGGAIGTEAVVRADPDGYTFLFHSGAIVTDALIKKNPTYDVRRDLLPVTMVATSGLPITINAKQPFNTLAEMVDYARKNPGKLNYGSPGIGSSVHLTTEMFNSIAGIKVQHVPYKGGGPAMTALIGGEVQILFSTVVTAKPQAAAGRIKALAITTATRASGWPELPPVKDAGVPGVDIGVWYAVFAPQKTPPVIVDRMNREIVAALRDPEFQKWLASNGLDPIGDTPDQFRAKLNDDFDRWGKLLKNISLPQTD